MRAINKWCTFDRALFHNNHHSLSPSENIAFGLSDPTARHDVKNLLKFDNKIWLMKLSTLTTFLKIAVAVYSILHRDL